MNSRWQRWLGWAGWLVTCAPVYIVLSSARWKLTHDAWYVREIGRIGWMTSALEMLAALQLTAIVLLVMPWTSVLGAVLLTGYLGGAVPSYVRIGEYVPAARAVHDGGARAGSGSSSREPRLRRAATVRRQTSIIRDHATPGF